MKEIWDDCVDVHYNVNKTIMYYRLVKIFCKLPVC